MPFRPLQWARRSVEGRQIEADGSRLLDFYAVQLADPEVSKVVVMIYSSPGARRYLKVPPEDVVMVTPPKGIHALTYIDSPAYGKRLFGLSSRYQLFYFRVGAGYDFAASYNPFAAMNADDIVEVADAQRFNFTEEEADSVAEDQPSKLVTDGRRLMWVSNNEVFLYDMGKTGGEGFVSIAAPVPSDISTLEDLTDQDWVDCLWIDGYFIIAARSGQFFHSQLDSHQFDQLDFAHASTNPDPIIGLASLNRRIYVLGSETVETWWNSGGTDFAFSRDNSFTHNVGCASKATITTDQEHVTFLGSDKIVYQLNSSARERISSESVEYDIARSEIEKSRAVVYTEEGHRFYSLTLMFDDDTKKNWTYDYATQAWHERGLDDVLCSVAFNKRILIGREGHEHIFDLRLDWGSIEDDDADEDDATIDREAVGPTVFINLHRVQSASFQADIPLRDGDDDDSILLEWSDDGKKTWKGSTDQLGNSKARNLDDGPRFRWSRLGQFRTGRNYRLTTSAKRRVDILGVYTDQTVQPD